MVAGLVAVTNANANGVVAATYTYDAFVRIRTFTDSEGWTATYDYDAADRVTKVTYPDGTAEISTYNRLDLASFQDRQGRLWKYTYDANRRLTATVDPMNQQTVLGYNRRGQITALTDARSNTTGWAYDVQGRLTTKTYADTSTVTYAYENTTSRLKTVTDALSQVKTYLYAKDDRPLSISYSNAANPTPNVAFTWDPYFPRLASMTDGTGTKQYTYVPVGSLGALQLQQESGPLPASTITSAYDELGRLSGRTVAGAGAETFQYDAIGRLTGRTSDLGAFTLGYLGQTDQVTTRQLASSTLATTFSYLNNAGDRRLSGIANVGLTAGQFSTFAFTTTPEDFVASIGETADTAAVYPPAGTQAATYNNLNQLTVLSGQARTYDAIGNLTSDGTRTYTWDAESRLVGIGYPGTPGKASAFTYDGLGRRTAIAETPPGGGPAVTTSYLWCDDAICQARDASNSTIRAYHDEGEIVPGSPAQPYYYGIDQLGSVRRAFATTSSAPAYGYDPYGVPLQVTAPVTDFGYAGLFNHPASGLNLTLYRAYDPVAGRWLSRDPLGEPSDPYGNLYAYVAGNTPNLIDPTGENPFAAAGAAGGFFGGLAGSIGGQLYNNGGNLNCVSLGQAFGDAVEGAGIGGAGAGLLAGIFRRAAAALAGRTAAAASVQKSTGIVARDGLNISGYTRHGVNRAIGDGGSRAGTSPRAILDALKNPARIRERIDGTGRQSRIYTGEDAQVVVNPQTGNIISVNPLAGSGVR